MHMCTVHARSVLYIHCPLYPSHHWRREDGKMCRPELKLTITAGTLPALDTRWRLFQSCFPSGDNWTCWCHAWMWKLLLFHKVLQQRVWTPKVKWTDTRQQWIHFSSNTLLRRICKIVLLNLRNNTGDQTLDEIAVIGLWLKLLLSVWLCQYFKVFHLKFV